MKIDSKVNDSIAMKGMDSNPQTSLQRRHSQFCKLWALQYFVTGQNIINSHDVSESQKEAGYLEY